MKQTATTTTKNPKVGATCQHCGHVMPYESNETIVYVYIPPQFSMEHLVPTTHTCLCKSCCAKWEATEKPKYEAAWKANPSGYTGLLEMS